MKVGEYVRTDNCIGKVYDICHKEEDYYKFIIENHGTLRICDSDYIVKSSPNIIDLIEVGDILTIRDIFGNLSKVEVDENFKLLSGKIISIVTHEQFSQMEYRIGE